MWRKWNPGSLLMGMQAGADAVEDSLEAPQRVKNGITI